MESFKYNSSAIPTHRIIHIVNPKDRITSNIMTLYERTEIVSIRAAQIQNGAKIYTDVKNLSDPIKMAEKEIDDRKCPLMIRRQINDFEAEDWEVNEMGYYR